MSCLRIGRKRHLFFQPVVELSQDSVEGVGLVDSLLDDAGETRAEGRQQRLLNGPHEAMEARNDAPRRRVYFKRRKFDDFLPQDRKKPPR